MALELGMAPVKFVIMGKRLSFLQYILKESTESMVQQVYMEMKKESRKGDFCHQIKADLNQLEIKRTENEIKEMSKYEWKKYLKIKIKEAALKHLQNENARLFETM